MVKVFPNIEELNNFAAEKFVEIAKESIEKRGRMTVALAGGSTPKSLYRLLAGKDFKNQIDWNSVYFFFGDERNVPPDNAESNFRMANENLFEPLEIDRDRIYGWEASGENAINTAKEYAQFIEVFFKGFPRFDLILLGMGNDGHTASLFPFTEALHETEKSAVANEVEKLNTTRLTLTFPTINNAENVIFLIAGANKAEVLKEVLEGDFQPEKLPSQNVKPDGNSLFLLDQAAAHLLEKL